MHLATSLQEPVLDTRVLHSASFVSQAICTLQWTHAPQPTAHVRSLIGCLTARKARKAQGKGRSTALEAMMEV